MYSWYAFRPAARARHHRMAAARLVPHARTQALVVHFSSPKRAFNHGVVSIQIVGRVRMQRVDAVGAPVRGGMAERALALRHEVDDVGLAHVDAGEPAAAQPVPEVRALADPASFRRRSSRGWGRTRRSGARPRPGMPNFLPAEPAFLPQRSRSGREPAPARRGEQPASARLPAAGRPRTRTATARRSSAAAHGPGTPASTARSSPGTAARRRRRTGSARPWRLRARGSGRCWRPGAALPDRSAAAGRRSGRRPRASGRCSCWRRAGAPRRARAAPGSCAIASSVTASRAQLFQVGMISEIATMHSHLWPVEDRRPLLGRSASARRSDGPRLARPSVQDQGVVLDHLNGIEPDARAFEGLERRRQSGSAFSITAAPPATNEGRPPAFSRACPVPDKEERPESPMFRSTLACGTEAGAGTAATAGSAGPRRSLRA